MVSDFDFIGIHAAARKSKQRHRWFLGNLPYLPRPPAALFRAGGCHRLRLALPHHSPACAVASPELTNTEGTPPKSLTGREKVSLCPVSVIASGLPQPGQWLRSQLGRLGFTTSLKPSVIAPLHLPLGIQGKYLWHRICSFQGPDEGLGACLHIQVGVAPLKVLTHRNGIVPKNCPSISRDIFGGTFIGGLEIFF